MPEARSAHRLRTHVLRWAKDLLVRLDRTRTFGLAAETAFWLLLSLVPLAAVLGLVAARLSMGNWRDAAPLLSSLPAAARDLVGTELARLATWNGGTVGAGSAAMFLWLASTGVHSIFDSLELQVGSSRPWWKKRLLALAACVALSVAVALLAFLGPGLDRATGSLGAWLPSLRGLGGPGSASRALRLAVSAAIVFGYTCGLYRLGIPSTARRPMPIVPGAVVAMLLEIASGYVYALYLAEVGDGGAYVAGLAAIGVTMMGLYTFVAALLVGAAVNRQLGDAATPASVPSAAPFDQHPAAPGPTIGSTV